MSDTFNIIMVGVGGQGSVLSSKLFGELVLRKGFDVKVSEVHGMSQRGGSVITYARFGKHVASPMVDLGEADIIVSFELLEGARYLPWLKKGGKLITNTRHIDPMPVITGAMAYPENLEEKLSAGSLEFIGVDALEIALKAGNGKAINVVMMGVLAKYMDFETKDWEDAIRATVPAKFVDANLRAFALANG